MRPTAFTLSATTALACELSFGLPDVSTTSAANDGTSVTTEHDATSAAGGPTADDPTTMPGDTTSTTVEPQDSGESTSTSASDAQTASDTSGDADNSTTGCSGTESDGAICQAPCDCASGACFSFGDDSLLWSTCGECDGDADCPGGGCNAASWLSLYPSSCHDGALGGSCESDTACDPGLSCALMVEIAGQVTHRTCSACLSDADCADDTLCSPTYDVASAGGFRSCVAPGSLPLGASCDPFSNGASACASGICSTVDILSELAGPPGFVVGVCSECVLNDCIYPQVCSGASLDTRTLALVAATCISKV